MPECAKTHLQQSRISRFSGGGPPDPPLQGEGREGNGGEEREGKGREGGRRRIGKRGTGRDRGGKEGGRGGMGVGRGARHGLRPPPSPRDKLWIRSWTENEQMNDYWARLA